MVIKPKTPTSPFAIPLHSRSAICFNAFARIKTEKAIPTIDAEAFIELLPFEAILLNSAIAPTNSPNKTVIAPSEDVSLFGSIDDITRSDAARIPIAVAIFISVPAFKLS